MTSNWLPSWNSNKDKRPFGEEEDHVNEEGGEQQSGVDSQQTTDYSSVKKDTARSMSSTLAPGGWLSWRRNIKDHLEDNNEHGPEGDKVNEEEEEEVIESEDNNDEIDDHVTRSKKKGTSSSWSFWSNNREYDVEGGSLNGKSDNGSDKIDNMDPNNRSEAVGSSSNKTDKIDKTEKTAKTEKLESHKDKDKDKEKHKKTSSSNTILRSNPALTGREGSDETAIDDAVLYKPHNDPKQFNKIDIHKNENLKENVIVPNWDYCLPNQTSILPNNNIASIFGNSSTSNQSNNNKMDLKNWRQFLNQLSTKLGFSSQTLTSVMTEQENDEDSREGEEQQQEQQQQHDAENTAASKDRVEKEFNLLYERTYRLYGRALAKLPSHKRACLPNYNKYYTKSKTLDDSYRYQQRTQLEEDMEDPNTVSISNDPMGNLLINHKSSSKAHKSPPPINQSAIVNQGTSPLKRIKKVLIIGVHGFFPTKMIRPLIGAPKGTSLKFANEAERAVIHYCIENNIINENDSNDLSIQKIALEKEGKIFDRVEFFMEILTKWQEELNDADFIFIASHSQGCVVSIILFAKLIRLGILKDPISKRIGILGMAGINNGPFYGVDKSFFMKAYSAIEHDSLMELFELTKFTSQQSLVYKESMQVIINANVKLCFIGSINDQLVPLYSALASHVYHPNIYRACYIDYSSQTPLFIQKLVSLCCQLQNLGYFDNNVLKELSTALAGPLTGGGHSKIYNDGKVYDLGIKFFLDTDDIVIPPPDSSKLFKDEDIDNPKIENNSKPKDGFVTSGVGPYGLVSPPPDITQEVVKLPVTNQLYIKEFNISKIGTNPFILPWCLRGLLFNVEKNWPNNNKLLSVDKGNELGKTGYDEISELFEIFDTWKPESKILKDLKFRLNGLRASKL